ncbi:Nitrogen regulatory protein P-II [Sedimentisphaera cyanobacteriorum]|uniref:Nitrogen regulatory protein P-II n=1 Tax=Sedimentisphaera cyanobacteriorum TaxID=1940790 RepID=A0A1Q2HRT3_9BACT|nr:P-II family nitrogen regulator [Sedimentisphaera cyanobacteriorum]AQQ10169.1 Nitrogen regulatory protein P-II [Sedimentisphaera cyanobacteriorum]
MKMIIAFVKPNMLDAVMLALHKIEGLTGASSSEVQGFGQDRSVNDREISFKTSPHIKLELSCHNDLVDQVLSAIAQAAHTGLRGDGKIYVLPLNDAVRISSKERGEKAV